MWVSPTLVCRAIQNWDKDLLCELGLQAYVDIICEVSNSKLFLQSESVLSACIFFTINM